MKKGKLYTILGVSGVQLSRTKGLSVLYDGISTNTESINETVFDLVAQDVDGFVNDGLDILVETDTDLVVEQIVASGNEDDFELTVNYDEIDSDEDYDEPDEQ